MMPGKFQRSKQSWQDLCWKVHGHAQSFVVRSYTMHELRNRPKRFYWLVASTQVNTYCILSGFVHGQGQKREQKHITKNFAGLQ